MPDFRKIARRKARKYGVDPDLFVAQINAESSFDPDVIYGRRLSRAKAAGIAQFMPETARGLGVDPLKPRQALDAAARLMADYIDKYGVEGALRAYNAGPAAIERSKGYSETNAYVQKILADARRGGGDIKTGRVAGGARGGGGGAGVLVQAMRGESMPAAEGGEGTVALLQALGALRQPAPVSGSLPAPAFSAAPALPQGFQPPASGGTAQAGRTGLDVGDLLGLVQPGQTAEGPQPGGFSLVGVPGGGGGGGGGPLLHIGDSLGVGTSQFLKSRRSVVEGGRTSTDLVAKARGELRSGRYGRILLDFGTNDTSPRQLAQSVRRVKRLAPNAQIFVPEIKGGRDSAAKTRVLRGIPGVTVVPWSQPIGPDGYHPTNYQGRARDLRSALGAAGGGGGGGGALRGGPRGRVQILPGAERPGVPLRKPVVRFLEVASGIAGRPIVVSTASRHRQFVEGRPGVQSEHWDGWAVDLGSVANKFPVNGEGGTRIAAAALMAAGVPRKQALRMAAAGGVHDIPQPGGGRVQVIWRAKGHFDHVHVGYRPGRR